MERVSAVIVTFYPKEEHFQNINRIAQQVEKVYLIDNTEKEIFFYETEKNVEIIKNKRNIGLASALNIGIKLSIKEGFDSVFLFDQDTVVPKKFVDRMLSFKQKLKKENVLIFAPQVFDTGANVLLSFLKLEKFHIKKIFCENDYIFPTFVITSASLLDLEKVKKIGFLRGDFFIDFVDDEYCLRALKNGYKIAVNCEVIVKHSIGKRKNVRLFRLFPLRPNNHPPVRKYYIARNSVRTTIEYFSYLPSVLLFCLRVLIHEFLSVLFFEENKLKKIWAMLLGIKDGLLNKMGKCRYRFCYNKKKI